MSRWNQKRRNWLLSKARKEARKKHKNKYGWKGNASSERKKIPQNNIPYPSTVIKPVPKIFSLTLNPEGTMQFISGLIDEIKRKEYRKTIYIDSSKVESVTVDALIYLIAIMKNDKINVEMNYRYVGNLPQNEEAKKVYQESGFLDYVQSKINNWPPNTDKKKICFGKTDDSERSAEFCTFAYQHFKKDRIYTIPLQKVLIELMSNVAHHAYEENEAIANNWYMYAEHEGDTIHFVFVDTGAGIIKTVRKKIAEKVFTFLGAKTVEGDILKSVFQGDFMRTETNESHRGNGLKTVYEDVMMGTFENFKVITGKGSCSIDKYNKTLICDTYNNSLHGTLYSFDYVVKEEAV